MSYRTLARKRLTRKKVACAKRQTASSAILARFTMRPADAYRLKYRSGGNASQTIEPSITASVDSLPDELLARILSPVDLKSLVQARAVCKSWRASVEGKAVSDLRVIMGGPNDFHASDSDDLFHHLQRLEVASVRQGMGPMRPEMTEYVQQRWMNEASDTVFCPERGFRRLGKRLTAQSEGAAAAVVYV